MKFMATIGLLAKNIVGWMTKLGNITGFERKGGFAKPVHSQF